MQLMLFGIQLSISNWLRKLGWFKVAPLDRTSSSELAAFWLQMEQWINKSWEDFAGWQTCALLRNFLNVAFPASAIIAEERGTGNGNLAVFGDHWSVKRVQVNPIFKNASFEMIWGTYLSVGLPVQQNSSWWITGPRRSSYCPPQGMFGMQSFDIFGQPYAMLEMPWALNSRGDQFEGLKELSMKEDVSLCCFVMYFSYLSCAWDCLHLSFELRHICVLTCSIVEVKGIMVCRVSLLISSDLTYLMNSYDHLHGHLFAAWQLDG